MRRHIIFSRIILILTVITFALAAPALVQEKRQAVHVPEDVVAILGKRTTREQDLDMLWDGLRYWEHVWGPLARVPLHEPVAPPNPAEVHVPQVPVAPPNPAEVHVPEAHVAPPNPADVHVAPAAPQNPADPDRESMDIDDDAPPGSPESGYSVSSTNSEGSTESKDWYTAPSSLGSSTDSDSDSDPDRWSTISNAPSSESQSENLKAADSEMIQLKGKAKVSRRTSGTASGVDTMNAAQMELRSAVDPGP
jgi:hypothetical protein